jgi:5-methylcytosine-specific restriction endonuclease McrA
MRAKLKSLLRLAVATDAEAAQDADGIWTTRCLHCRTRLQVAADGEALGASSLEHVVPRAWFGLRAAAALTAQVGEDRDDPRNLALACRRCNQDKGRGPDARGPQDPRAHAVVAMLLAKRLARWRAIEGDGRTRPPGQGVG